MPALLYLLASMGNLLMAVVVIALARRARGSLPIALLCVALFAWNVGEGAFLLAGTHDSRWKLVALTGSSLAPAFLFHFVLVFTRRDRHLRTWGLAMYALSGLLAISTAGAFTLAILQAWVDSRWWNAAYLTLLFPFLLASLLLVARRRREVENRLERNAANFVAFGIAVGALTGFSDLLAAFGSPIPFLGHVGSLAVSIILAIAIFRHRLLDEETPIRRTLLVTALAAAVVLANASFALQLERREAFAAVTIGAVTLVALALYRLLLLNWYETAERRRRLALVGTMAAGVAHEIKNPLASIKGAAQYVQAELESGRTGPEPREYLDLLVREVDRLNGVIEDFLAFARPREPRRRPVDVNALAADTLRLQETAKPAGVTIRSEFDPDLPRISADPDLLAQALVNLVRNAFEAMPDGGELVVSTRLVRSPWGGRVVLSVEDRGSGLDPADAERLFEPFHTTKSKGTGLGLPIARRIVEAHGGEITVERAQPRGARFSLQIPAHPA